MIMIPLKWMPYLLIIAGVSCFFTGEAGLGMGMAVAGAVWLLGKKKSRPSQGGKAGTGTTGSTGGNAGFRQAQAAQTRFCPSCGAKLTSGSVSFCETCGCKIS